MTETVASLLAGYRSGKLAVSDIVKRTFDRLRAADDPAIFISVRDEADVMDDATALAGRDPATLPLFGVPVAVKDNIDVAGLPTTAACPAFAYTPTVDAVAVRRLREAGALIIGKTNLDQFATGLVGARSPYGMPRNALREDLVSGGSSSGSAVAVALGIVPLSLGTDTAGSGRVPAGLNNIVGLKPTLGLIPATGVVPACRSLDTISVFALTVEDGFAALSVMAGPDASDAFSRSLPLGAMATLQPGLRIAVPRAEDRIFLGDTRAEASFALAIERVRELGASIVEIDMTPLFETARLLYEGPWVAERTAAIGDFLAAHTDDVHPITKTIISQGVGKSAVDTFRGLYRLRELRGIADKMFAGFDALMVPTMPKPATVAEVAAKPIAANSALGTYTNFVNLLDLAGIAVPVSLADDAMPHGVTFLSERGRDTFLADLGAAMHARSGLKIGALNEPLPSSAPAKPQLADGEIAIAVVGAHMSGMALNGELTQLSGRFLEATTTSADYRLFALAGTTPARPGMLRIKPGIGTEISLEIWALSADGFGKFVSTVPAPLSIGSVRLKDGRLVKGFLAEAEGVAGGRDISEFGGWRAYVASLAKS